MITSLLTAATLTALAASLAAVYLLPVLIGVARRVPDIGAVAVIDILLGWTLLGWVVALAMALRSTRPVGPVVQVVQNLPQLPPPPAPRPGPPPSRSGPPPLVLPPPHAGPGGPPATDPATPEEPVPPAYMEDAGHGW